MARESHSTADNSRGSIFNFGPQNGVSVVGDRAVVMQTNDGGAATGDNALRPAEPAAVAPDPWRFVLREDATRWSLARGPLATLEVHSPHAPGQRLEWPVEPRVPNDSQQLELDWYFRQQWQDRDPARANEIERLLGRLGEQLFASLFSDDEALRYWRNAFDSGHEIVWNIQGSPRFHRSPWELLRHVHNGLEYDVALRFPFARRVTQAPALSAAPPGGSAKLSVLWFVARPGDDIIPDDAVTKSVLEHVGGDVEIDLVVDGRFKTLRDRLWEQTRRPRYHMLHLDLHGLIASGQDLRARAERRPRNWIVDDRSGRGDVPSSDEETGWLLFADERRRDPASATEVARMISQARIPIVVLNACDSAAVPEADSSSGWSDSSSLAARLVEAGGFSAVGFSNALSLPGAQRFFGEFYRTLVQSPDRGRLDQAVIRGRQALHERRTRGNIPLSDWSLPVWYTSRDELVAE